KRHSWASMVLWIDNPVVETPKILGASLSQQTLEPTKHLFLSIKRNEEPYQMITELDRMDFVGTQQIRHTQISKWHWNYTYEGGSNVSTRVSHTYTNTNPLGWITLTFTYEDGTYHDLIMWEQLTDAAREGLNSADFGETKVPFNENNFEATLKTAWPF
ncbi:Necrosis inducing protein NPP1, partial [Phytophthora megakarya]